MKSSALIKQISQISTKEVKLFTKFVRSVYWNTNEDIIRLVSLLGELYPFTSTSKLERQNIWNQLFPNKAFNYNKLRILFSQTLKYFETFVTIESICKDENVFNLKLLREVAEKNHADRFKKKRTQLELSLANEKKKDSKYFQLKTELLNISDRYYTSKNDYSNRNLLKERAKQLDIYYYIEKLSICCELLNRSKFFKDEYHYPEMELLEKHLESEPSLLQTSSVLKIYYWVYLTLKSPDNENIYFQLKEELKKSAFLFSQSEFRDIHIYLLNYISRRINTGKREFLRESFDLLKLMMEEKILIQDEILEEAHYKNFITTGIRNNEYDYIEYFIENYTQYLNKDVRDNAFSYNLANVFYAKGEYDKAQSLLIQVEYSDINYNLDSKSLLLRIYFDADEGQALYAHINTVKIYLMRNKLININKYRRYHQLFRFTKALFKIKENIGYDSVKKTKEKLDKLESQIKNVKAISNKQWLLEKLNEIKK